MVSRGGPEEGAGDDAREDERQHTVLDCAQTQQLHVDRGRHRIGTINYIVILKSIRFG